MQLSITARVVDMNDVAIKNYKKTVKDNKVTFEIEFPSTIADADKATWLAVGIILQMTEINGADYVLKPLKVHI